MDLHDAPGNSQAEAMASGGLAGRVSPVKAFKNVGKVLFRYGLPRIGDRKFCISASVSYTHLDVYKRQMWTSP